MIILRLVAIMLMLDMLQNVLATSFNATLDNLQNIADTHTTTTGSSWRQDHIPDSLQNVGTGAGRNRKHGLNLKASDFEGNDDYEHVGGNCWRRTKPHHPSKKRAIAQSSSRIIKNIHANLDTLQQVHPDDTFIFFNLSALANAQPRVYSSKDVAPLLRSYAWQSFVKSVIDQRKTVQEDPGTAIKLSERLKVGPMVDGFDLDIQDEDPPSLRYLSYHVPIKSLRMLYTALRQDLGLSVAPRNSKKDFYINKFRSVFADTNVTASLLWDILAKSKFSDSSLKDVTRKSMVSVLHMLDILAIEKNQSLPQDRDWHGVMHVNDVPDNHPSSGVDKIESDQLATEQLEPEALEPDDSTVDIPTREGSDIALNDTDSELSEGEYEIKVLFNIMFRKSRRTKGKERRGNIWFLLQDTLRTKTDGSSSQR
jgi:hypothetical protein